jgi:WD40 repeat protein/serine/threonine protein kinase
MSESSSERNPVEELAEEFLARCRRGERPALSEYTNRYPQWAEKIRSLFPLLIDMEAARPVPHEGSSPEAGILLSGDPKPQRLGDYEVLREVGRGGMGIVLEAVQVSLGRHVALKVLPRHALVEPLHLQRFQREAKAAARLHHTNIVPVYGVGEENGLHYYVMQYIHGLGLDAVLAELRRLRRLKQAADSNGQTRDIPTKLTPDVSAAEVAQSLLSGNLTGAPRVPGSDASRPEPAIHLPGQSGDSSPSETGRPYWHSVARIGVQAAEALAYAHSQYIVHRDIKPSNLLLDIQGTVWVTDFGLAKAADSEDLTHSGDVVGTLRYLAPERFQGKADVRSDVYALGLTVYELLTLRPAFDESDRNKLMAQVMQAEPLRPRLLRPQVPHDLETIVLKAIDRDPSRRYQTAAELAEDLKRYIAGEPIRARRVSAWQRLILWAKRRPAEAAAVLFSGVAALALAGAGVAVFYNTQLQKSFEETDLARQTATAALDEARFHQYFHYLARAYGGVLAENLVQVEKLLDSCAADRRGWEWHYLKRLCHADLLTLGHTGSVGAVAYSPDGTWLASSGDDGVRIWDATTGKIVRHIRAHQGGVRNLAISRDGTRLASVGSDVTFKLWDTRTWQWVLDCEESSATGQGGDAFSVAFSPDGTRLATSARNSLVKIWDTATGRAMNPLKGHGNAAVGIAYSPDGTRLASADWEGLMIIWDTRTGAAHYKLPGHVAGAMVAFSPDGTLLAAAGANGSVRIWSAMTGEQVRTFIGHSSTVRGLQFSPDGARLASGSADGAVKLWDLSTGQLLFTYLGHTNEIRHLAFSPDGTRLASASSDQTVKVWDTFTGPGPRTLTSDPSGLVAVAFSPDGTRIAAAGRHGAFKLWDVTTGQEVLALEAPRIHIWSVAFSPDGARLASAGRAVNLWDARTGHKLPVLRGHTNWVRSVVFSPDGTRLASASDDQTVKLWDAASGQVIHTCVGHSDSVRSVVFSPDGTRLASASWDNSIIVWDATTGRLLRTVQAHARWVDGVAFSLDGTRLVSASDDCTLKVWSAMTGEMLLPPLAGHTSSVNSVTFSPDGTRLASVSFDGTVKVWDAATGEEVLTLKGHLKDIRSVAFSPDGTQLASASDDGTVKLWDARPWTAAAAMEREALGVLGYLFAKPLCQGDVLQYLRTSPTITPAARQLALTLIERYREETNPERYHQISWAILRQPYLNALQYRFALRQTETAYRLAPEDGQYRTPLGVAQYRVGQYTQARATLTQADILHRAALASLALLARQFPQVCITLWQAVRLHDGVPANLAFLAMTHHQLGQKEQAQAALARLRIIADRPGRAKDEEVQAFLSEAETVLASKRAEATKGDTGRPRSD